ncbi:hypothetical protein BC830DRAFT_1108184 [Chytriomyces sp. MP71]|nr:hypothetical protein BC830DRAFT_1108184 [Chytriomyces sp. MP71]
MSSCRTSEFFSVPKQGIVRQIAGHGQGFTHHHNATRRMRPRPTQFRRALEFLADARRDLDADDTHNPLSNAALQVSAIAEGSGGDGSEGDNDEIDIESLDAFLCSDTTPTITQSNPPIPHCNGHNASVVDIQNSTDKIRFLNKALDNMQTIRKDRVFESDITQEEALLIQKRVALQQEQYRVFEEREFEIKSQKILGVFDYLTKDEIKQALKEYGHNEDTVIVKFTDPEYLQKIRNTVTLLRKGSSPAIKVKAETVKVEENVIRNQRGAHPKSKSVDDKGGLNKKLSKSRFNIDAIAEPNVNREEIFEGWSQARVMAYKSIEECPNRYYYRFNAPGEMQRNGVWTAEEKDMFMKRLNEVGATGNWGIFSIPIPGRVGYQCATFYRALIRKGEIKDPNYTITAKGALQYRGGTTTRNEEDDDGENSAPEKKPKRKKAKRELDDVASLIHAVAASSTTVQSYPKLHAFDGVEPDSLQARIRERILGQARKQKLRRRDRNDSDESSFSRDEPGDESEDSDHLQDDFENAVASRSNPKRASRNIVLPKASLDALNPLPGFIDPITLDPIVKPAISPYGHVVGYDTWISCLNNKLCPFTKKPLTRRDLVILTKENIDEYRHSMINV